MGRVDYALAPLAEIVLVATFVGIVFLLATHTLPRVAADVTISFACNVAVIQALLSLVSIQWRRLKDIGYAGYHVLWIDAGLGALSHYSPPAYVAAGLVSTAFFLGMPGVDATGQGPFARAFGRGPSRPIGPSGEDEGPDLRRT